MAEADAPTTNEEELLTISDHVNHLRKWLQQQQPALTSLDTDEFLLRFLRVSDFRLENAKEWLINYWKYRTENPQWFKNRDLVNDPLMCQISQLAYCLQLPQPNKDKQLIFVMRMGCYDPGVFTIDDVTRYAFAVTDTINSQPAAQLYGFIILLDMTNIRLHHISQFTPDRARRYADCWEKMYPVHLRKVHFYNYPSIFDPILHLFRMCFRRKFNDRLHFHARSSDDTMKKSLQEYIEPSILPQEYGGALGSIEEINQTFVQWTRDRNQMMMDLEKYGIDLKQVQPLLKSVRKEHET